MYVLIIYFFFSFSIDIDIVEIGKVKWTKKRDFVDLQFYSCFSNYILLYLARVVALFVFVEITGCSFNFE